MWSREPAAIKSWNADVSPAGQYYAKEMAISDIDPSWYPITPPQQEKNANTSQDSELSERIIHSSWGGKVFNNKYLESADFCNTLSYSSDQVAKLKFLYAFESYDGTPFPRYRFHTNANQSDGLITNSMGWRGSQFELLRTPGIIRIVLVGSSTTVSGHSFPYSYADHLETWLNLWAEASDESYRFEVLNSGRSGINSTDLAAVVKNEVLPLQPDIVIYYEGSNQFWPSDYVEWPNNTIPKKPILDFKSRSKLRQYSAIYGRLVNVTIETLEEPKKPNLNVDWPEELKTINADSLTSDELPLNLETILQDLDDIHSSSSNAGVELAISSFVWLSYDGMELDSIKHRPIYVYLNQSYWPYSYAHIKRYADFQNDIFEFFARDRSLKFLDVAGQFPQDPIFFTDAIHMYPQGIRLRGWIVFNEIVVKYRKQFDHFANRANSFATPARNVLEQSPVQQYSLAKITAHCAEINK